MAAARTAIGGYCGGLSNLSAVELGYSAVIEALKRARISPEDVCELIMGQVLTAGKGQNTARQVSIRAGIPVSSTAITINQVCGSGLRSVAMGCQAIELGDSDIIVAGGQESMSQSLHCASLRKGRNTGDIALLDTMISDGLWDSFHDYHMGNTAENVARRFNIERSEQDDFALASQQKAEVAQNSGRFADEIVSVKIVSRKEEITVDKDEHPRPGTTLEGLQRLKPAFDKEGTITAGNSSGMNDGAAAAVLMSADEASRRGLEPLARVASWATAGVEPELMGIGPVPATKKALSKAGWSIDDLDLIEANEAFAAQACAVNKCLGWDTDKVNVNGGAIALGHPIGASGARILVSLLYEMRRRDARKGLTTLCIGGGMGITMCLER